MKIFDTIVTILLVVGGLNWGLIGVLEFDLVKGIFGDGSFVRVVYTLVGLAAVCKAVVWNIGGISE